MAQADEFDAFLHESHLRELAIETVIPDYPETALKGGISGIVRLKIEISPEGEVLRVKVYPKIAPQLKKASCEAAAKWRFKSHPHRIRSDRPDLGRLTFMFTIRGGQGVVGLYDPGPNAPDHERLGYYSTPRELREWRDWEACPNN